MKAKKIIYYSDELNDDFAGNDIKTAKVGKEFRFIHTNPLWKAAGFFLYYVIAVPLVWLFMKLWHGLKYENKKAIKKVKKSGYILYANHTQMFDSFLPATASFPKKGYVIANPDAVSIPFLRNIVQMFGCVPIPTEFSAMRPFMNAVNKILCDGGSMTIFPEAHIWPYYTGLRPFTDVSFRYAIKANVPVIPMATTYRKRKGLFALSKRPAMTVTVSEPIYPDKNLSPKEAQKKLRDETYAAMKKIISERENVEYIRYLKKEA